MNVFLRSDRLNPSLVRKLAPTLTLGLAVLLLLPLSGCHKTVDDATLTTNIQSAIAKDSTIGSQASQVQVAVQKGVATLTGTVSDETAAALAASDAAQVKGVQEVVNNLQVPGVTITPTVTSPAAPQQPRTATPQEQTVIQQHQSLPPPPTSTPEPPPVHTATAEAGADLPVRITESLSSENSQPGESFHGVLTHEVTSDGYVVLPAGAEVTGRVTDVKDATHFKGSSLLSIELTSVRRHGDVIRISTQPYVLEGKGRGKNSVEKIGGGAAIGAVLGGIFGGGKGAAIGAASGGGGGAAVQGFTRGQQVELPSESVVRFRLTAPITVQTAETASSDRDSGLYHHDEPGR